MEPESTPESITMEPVKKTKRSKKKQKLADELKDLISSTGGAPVNSKRIRRAPKRIDTAVLASLNEKRFVSSYEHFENGKFSEAAFEIAEADEC